MADVARIKGNVAKMLQQGAPEADVDAYLKTEGVTPEALRGGPSAEVTRVTSAATPPAETPESWSDYLKGGADEFVGQGVLAGFGDEAKAGVRAGFRRLLGQSGKSFPELYGQELGDTRDELKQFQGRHPVQGVALELAGGLLPAVAMPLSAAGEGVSLAGRMGRGIAAGAGYGATYGAGTGETPEERVKGALTGAIAGGVTGGVAPVAVRGVQALGRGLRDLTRKSPTISAARGLGRTEQEAQRRIAVAEMRDREAGQVIAPEDAAAAEAFGQPLMNVDRMGGATRSLMRASGTISPVARDVMDQALGDRFQKQGSRTADAVRSIVGGRTSLEAREALETAAQHENKANYDIARGNGDRPIWSPELERLTSSPAVMDAIGMAAKRGKNRAVMEGYGGFSPPVDVTPDGRVSFKKSAGVTTYPNLQFWDYTQRELGGAASSLRKAGHNEEAGALKGLQRQLNAELDKIEPSFKVARTGAARFFDAQDAVEAGEKFIDARMGNDVARKALGQMTPSERQLFSESFADALVRKVSETRDRRNVLDSIFLQTPAAKERIDIALGSEKARQLEAFLRVEDLMDKARPFIGGPNTAQKLAEAGIGTVASGYGYLTGDWKTAGGVLTFLLVKHGAGRVDQKVAERVAELLTSKDPNAITKGTRLIANNDRLLKSLRTIDLPLAISGAQEMTKGITAPLRINLNAGERDRMMQQTGQQQ